MADGYKYKGLISWIFRGVLLVGFLILFGRLVELQVIKGEYYTNLSEGNRIRRVLITPERGEIKARGGEILVGNKEIKTALEFSPQTGFSKVPAEESVQNVEIIPEWQRDYILGSQLGHVSGYLGEVNSDETGNVNPDCPEKGIIRLGSKTGRSGLEEEYQCTLSGYPGEELFEVDSGGNLVRKLGEKPSSPGEDILTNIDIGLQRKAADAMEGVVGTVVISDGNGQIMALYSSPSYDPNLFVKKDGTKKISELFQDPNKPFFNRALSGLYQPGSVYKPLVGLAALETGVIDRNFQYDDTGQVVVHTEQGDFSYKNWYFTQYGGVEGLIDLKRALARSTDTFFYKVGEQLGVRRIVEWSDKVGLGKLTGIDLPGEISGLVPTPEWKKETRGENWYLGNTYHMSIGQGDLALTPLSINVSIATILTGRHCTPRLVGSGECTNMNFSKEDIQTIREGMEAVCESGGTANVFFDFHPKGADSETKFACKTGTAETGKADTTHAWFTIAAPYKPGGQEGELFMTVLVEEGGEGSQVAAPIAKDILTYWYER